MHWIKAEIHEFILKNWRLVKIATTKAQRKLFFNLRSHKGDAETMSPQQVDELAKKLDVKREEVLEMETRLSGHDIALEPQSDDEDENFAPIAYLTDEEREPTQILEAREQNHLQTEGLSQALATLDDRSRRIVEARWLSEDNAMTLHELAKELGVSAERVRQIEVAAMKKMKKALLPYVA